MAMAYFILSALCYSMVFTTLYGQEGEPGNKICGSLCTFRLCNADSIREPKRANTVILHDAGIASPPFVCGRKVNDTTTERVKVNKIREAEVHPFKDRFMDPPPFVRISKYRPSGLNPRFQRNHFSLKPIRFPPIPNERGLARLESKGNQEEFLNLLCVRIPIISYRVLSKDGEVLKKVTTNREDDCLSALVVAPLILVELTWNSADDFDLIVIEPNGEKLYFRNSRSSRGTGGRYLGDENPNCSARDVDGREQTRWLRSGNPGTGEYTVIVKHRNSCGLGKSTWTLAVVIKGKLVSFQSGKSKIGRNKKVLKKTFRYGP